MSNCDLANGYLTKAKNSIKVMYLLKEDGFYYEVTQQAKTVKDIALKGLIIELSLEYSKEQDLRNLISVNR